MPLPDGVAVVMLVVVAGWTVVAGDGDGVAEVGEGVGSVVESSPRQSQMGGFALHGHHS